MAKATATRNLESISLTLSPEEGEQVAAMLSFVTESAPPELQAVRRELMEVYPNVRREWAVKDPERERYVEPTLVRYPADATPDREEDDKETRMRAQEDGDE